MALSSKTGTVGRRRGILRVGFVALTDAAPFAVAEAQGLFTERGLRVELHREIGWATIREKIIYGELDAAQAPGPMLWSVERGINCPPTEVLTALVLNLHGNAITLSNALWQAGVRDDAGLRTFGRERRRRHQPLTFGVVFPFSSHHLLLRSWLRSASIDPDRDVRIVIVPPAQMFRNLSAGTIDGFCAGEPWNTLAVRERVGWVRLCSAVYEPGHPEKVLMVTRAFADSQPQEHAALVSALSAACRWCDEPQNREPLAELLSSASYLNTPARIVAPSLVGRFDFGGDRVEHVPDFHVFHRGDANLPSVVKATAIQTALVDAGLIPAVDADPELPRRLFREDLYRAIVSQHLPNEIASVSELPGVSGS
jgi:two-component system, oxyanion-binding sensor